MKSNTVECQCGCGGAIAIQRWHKYNGMPRYLRGHASRVNPSNHRYTPTPDEIPSGLCECGCGGRTTIAKVTVRKRRYFAGHPVPYLKHHGPPQPKGEASPQWRGGVHRTAHGYVLQYAADHPEADRDGYVRQHRLVAEQMIGRRILPNESVHHINGVKDDNRPENLVVLTHAQHAAIHGPQRKFDSKTMSEAGKKGAAARWKN